MVECKKIWNSRHCFWALAIACAFFIFPAKDAHADGEACGVQPFDVCIMLDRTGSLSSSERNTERDAANSLVDNILGIPGSRVSAGAFAGTGAGSGSPNYNASIFTGLSSNATTVKNSITSFMGNSAGGTNIASAILRCQTELVNGGGTNPKVLILLSDGDANAPNGGGSGSNSTDRALALTQATATKALGIKIISISYGANGSGSDITYRNLMANISTNGINNFANVGSADQTKRDQENGIIDSPLGSGNYDRDDYFITLTTGNELNLVVEIISTVLLCPQNPDNLCATNTCIDGLCHEEVQDGCQPCTTPANCDDGNPCTVEQCTSGKCEFINSENGSSCSDGNECTQTDVCQAGSCVPGAPVDCTALDNCHVPGTCNPATGICNNPTKPDNSPCSDNDVCDGNEVCIAGACTPGTPINCDDGNSCKADSCDASGNCHHDPVEQGVECEDNNVCTLSDACDGEGDCEGTVNPCDDNNPCTDDSCDSQSCDPLVDQSCDGCEHNSNDDTSVHCYTGPEGTENVGECLGGVLECSDGELGEVCIGEVLPGTEICDGKDNDCNGESDDNLPPQPTSCGVGECANTGNLDCEGGEEDDSCEPKPPTTEICDGKDNDCDQQTDEDLGSTSCGVGVCQHSVNNCIDGIPQTCDPFQGASTEICDGIDNDCDGQVDEGFDVGTVCTEGLGACEASGTKVCTADHNGTECTAEPGLPSSDANCDGIDNDCSGTADEDYEPTDTSCGVGECAATGQMICQNGQEVDTCDDGEPGTEICDGKDNNCNGQSDEGFGLGVVCSEGTGACEVNGTVVCTADHSGTECSADPGTPTSDANCDGIDNDCNGTADEDYVPTDTKCGVGECAATGQIVCQNGQEVDNCDDGEPGTEICDGKDNNCNGQSDEGFGLGVVCSEGTGACEVEGTVVCTADHSGTECSADPGSPTSDANCDGIDNDCNGTADEDYVPTDTKCGEGECAATGQMVCQNGQEVDTCEEGEAGLEVCDGKDNNCDGNIDEGFSLNVACSEGTGACQVNGTMVCRADRNGTECNADPGSPTSDANCDGIDNDCNGTADEDYVPSNTVCGEGVCAAQGQLICLNGQTSDTCQPGEAPSDTDGCDGLDNNCNGSTDEGFVPEQTDCGEGACSNTGSTSCVGGNVVDSCESGSSATEVCDGIDNNCDGIVDNGGDGLCDDGNSCNGTETCGGDLGCVDGIPVDCNDQNNCTEDSCDPDSGECTHDAIVNDPACTDDGNPPTDGGIVGGPAPTGLLEGSGTMGCSLNTANKENAPALGIALILSISLLPWLRRKPSYGRR